MNVERLVVGRVSLALILAVTSGCEGTLDAGSDRASLRAMVDDSGAPDSDEPEPSMEENDASLAPSPVETVNPTPSQPPLNVDDAGPPVPEPPLVVDGGSEPQPAIDAGGETSEPLLPVDTNNPIVIINDQSTDSWFGEFAFLAASTDRINLAGIVVNTSGYWTDLDANRAGWQEMLDAARASGLRNLPDLVAGASTSLVVPADENVDATQPNGSVGAQFIVDTANAMGTPELPLVVVSGGSLTDIADAYLLDPTVSERLVVVAALGQASDTGAVVGGPNGELDKWAGVIVTQRLRFIQVSAYYEHSGDVPEARVGELPDNAFGAWMAGKVGGITNAFAADQVALLAVILPGFALGVERVGYTGRNPQGEALLGFQTDGPCWFVSESDGTRAADFLWEMLQDPSTFGP